MPGMLVHEEMAMLVEAGLSPMEAIQSATINVAKLFGKDKEFGTVEAGKIADLVIIDGDPIKDIWATQNVKMVLLSGKVMDINFHANHRNPIPSPESMASNTARDRSDAALDTAKFEVGGNNRQTAQRQSRAVAQSSLSPGNC